jgi:hypothetical protein
MKADSPSTDIIDAALLEVQRELTTVAKNKGVEVERGGTKVPSRYVTADRIYDVAHPLLIKNGITLWQGGEPGDKGGERLVTILAKGGQQRVSSFPIVAREGAQNFGGGLAFAKRWGLQAAVGIFTSDDPEEQKGYRDATREARPARRGSAPADLAAAKTAIMGCTSRDAFEREVQLARGAFPQGEANVAIERSATAWLVAALGTVATSEDLIALRDTQSRVKARGNDLRDAIGAAETRVKAGAP